MNQTLMHNYAPDDNINYNYAVGSSNIQLITTIKDCINTIIAIVVI